jgi:Fe-S cluster assembly iron-binding protein IscA
MALDEPKENDIRFVEDRITFLIDKGLFERVKPVNIDFIHTQNMKGFFIKSNLPPTCGCGCE